MANNPLAAAIMSASQSLGVSPVDLATAISYETGGTFDPWQQGPTTKWGRHVGLIQMGEPQRQKYGYTQDAPLDRKMEGVVGYLKDTGVKPGMGLLDIYSAINAGGVGRYNRSDAHAGGAPGTVRDKVMNQMGGHREKAENLLAGMGLPPEPNAVAATQAPQPSQPQSAPQGSMSSLPPAVASLLGGGGQSEGGSSRSELMAMLSQMQPRQEAPPQMQPAQIMGPSPEQANALLSLVSALKQRSV